MKNLSRILVASLMAAVLLVGCGKPKTLEAYFDEHDDEWQEITETYGDMCDIEVEENTMTYTFDIGGSYEGEEKDALAEQLESTMDSMSSTFESSKELIEKETEVDVEMVIVYVDGDGNEIYSATF